MLPKISKIDVTMYIQFVANVMQFANIYGPIVFIKTFLKLKHDLNSLKARFR